MAGAITVTGLKSFENQSGDLTLVSPDSTDRPVNYWWAPRWWWKGDNTIYEGCVRLNNSDNNDQIYIACSENNPYLKVEWNGSAYTFDGDNKRKYVTRIFVTTDSALKVGKDYEVPLRGEIVRRSSLAFLEYTTASVSSFRIRTLVTPNYDVDWGDGSTESGITAVNKDHTYSTAGVYTIKITPAAGSTFRPEHYGSTDHGTNLTKVEGTGGSQLGTDLTKWLRETTSLTSMGSVDTSSVANFQATWRGCSGLTSFPALNFSSATNFNSAWLSCSSLTSYPANVFDTTGTLVSTAFSITFLGCALTAQSIENILTSLDTNGSSNITLGINQGTNAAKTTWSTAANTAYTNLINKGWTISYNS